MSFRMALTSNWIKLYIPQVVQEYYSNIYSFMIFILRNIKILIKIKSPEINKYEYIYIEQQRYSINY